MAKRKSVEQLTQDCLGKFHTLESSLETTGFGVEEFGGLVNGMVNDAIWSKIPTTITHRNVEEVYDMLRQEAQHTYAGYLDSPHPEDRKMIGLDDTGWYFREVVFEVDSAALYNENEPTTILMCGLSRCEIVPMAKNDPLRVGINLKDNRRVGKSPEKVRIYKPLFAALYALRTWVPFGRGVIVTRPGKEE